jgi:hypothetical protein
MLDQLPGTHHDGCQLFVRALTTDQGSTRFFRRNRGAAQPFELAEH